MMEEKKLPEGWEVATLGNVIKLKNGFAFKSKNYKSEGVPVIRISDISQEGNVTLRNAVFVDKIDNFNYLVQKGDILIAMSGATTGKFGMYQNTQICYQNQRIGNLIPISDQISNKNFLFYLIAALKKEIEKRAYGGAQPNISAKQIHSIPFPLPPLSEQKRIVAKLDRLFAHMESVKAMLAGVPELLRQFRQSVLTQAATGKLTEEWREGKELGEWEEKLSTEVCQKVQSGGTPKKPFFENGDIPFLKVYNIQNQQIEFKARPQFIQSIAHTTKCKKSIALPGDVIMNIVGPPLNKVAIVTDEYPEWNHNQAITQFRPSKDLIDRFLYYTLREGSNVREIIQETRGVVGQINISLSQCRNFKFNVPPLKEQKEIVRRVDLLFAKADAIEAQYLALKAQIDVLPQAILAKAFRGELIMDNG